jgi:hypothetical protein
MSARLAIGRNVNRHGPLKGDLATHRAKELGISRATWFRRVKQGLVEKPAPPPNEAERHAAWKLRRLERQRAANAVAQSAFARWIETLKVAVNSESHLIALSAYHRLTPSEQAEFWQRARYGGEP